MYPFFQNIFVTYVIFLVDFSRQVANNVKNLTFRYENGKIKKQTSIEDCGIDVGKIRIIFCKAATATASLNF